jgi:hypothetical protein
MTTEWRKAKKINNQGKANQNYKILLTLIVMSTTKKKKKERTVVGEDVEKMNPLDRIGRNGN